MSLLGVIRVVPVLVCRFALIAPAKARQRVDPRNMNERVLAIRAPQLARADCLTQPWIDPESQPLPENRCRLI